MSDELKTVLIDEFAAARRAKKTTHAMTEALKGMLGTVTEYFERQTFLRASKVWNECSREIVFRNLLPLPPPVTTANNVGMQMRMSVGTYLHSFFQNEVLGPAGVLYGSWIPWEKQFDWELGGIREGIDVRTGFYPQDGNKWYFIEETVTIEEWKVKGHTDGMICMNRMQKVIESGGKPFFDDAMPIDLRLLEIKTTDDSVLREIKSKEVEAVIDVYKCQATLYQHAKKVSATLFVYIDRKYFQIHSFEYKGEEKYLEHTKQKSIECFEYPKERKLPPRCAECISAISKRATACPYVGFCFSEMPELVFEITETEKGD